MTLHKEFDVVGLGVSTLDLLHLVEHFPSDETVQESDASALEGGGPVATAIVTLARLGAKVTMLDSLGDDWRGRFILDEFKKENVGTKYIKIYQGHTSSIASVLVRRADGARTIIYSPGSSPELTADDINCDLIARSKFIHINGRHFNACLKACKTAREHTIKVSFDGGSHRFRPELADLISMSDICIVSRNFSEEYSHQTEMEPAARLFLKSGPSLVVITDGTRGSWIFTEKGEVYHQPAYILPGVVDTTGCGDSYHGAFLFGLCNGFELKKTSAIASAVAALNAGALGGRSGLPSYKQVLSFLGNNVVQETL